MQIDMKKLEVAMKYIERIADGKNPVNNKPTEDDSVLNNPNVIRCMYFVKEVLTVVKENDGVVIALITARIDKYVKGVDRYFIEDIKVTGVARCHRDTFDETTGKKLARAKAERSAYIAARNILYDELRDINRKIYDLAKEIMLLPQKIFNTYSLDVLPSKELIKNYFGYIDTMIKL